jgi:protein phosphatase
MQHEVLSRVRAAVEGAGLFEELDTDWLCLDCELMPWSAKAQELLTSQYAAVGAAANLALPEVIDALGRAESAGADVQDLLRRAQERAQLAKLYVDSYRHYCWPVASVDDLKLARFHLLASDRGVHADKDHGWHLALLSRLSDGDPILLATPYLIVDLADELRGGWRAMVGTTNRARRRRDGGKAAGVSRARQARTCSASTEVPWPGIP